MATTTIAASIRDLTHTTRPLTRLVRFFAKYPPSKYSAAATGQAIPTTKQRIAMDAKPLSSTNVPQAKSLPAAVAPDATNPMELNEVHFESMSSVSEVDTIAKKSAFPPNPFLPYKNPETGRWRGARVGLRQQGDLFKYAREYGIETLLPTSVKSSAYKQRRALERGLAVKGTGEGQQVKGHKWERTRASILEKRRQAMEQMPELIREWEQKGHGRGWKKYPK